jgi:hypothetical protein
MHSIKPVNIWQIARCHIIENKNLHPATKSVSPAGSEQYSVYVHISNVSIQHVRNSL